MARDAGVHALWFGIEDLTATLINKGQKPTQTIELFGYWTRAQDLADGDDDVHEAQPYHTPGALYGLYNQIKFLHEAGAVSVQCTVHSPAVGTREQEAIYAKGGVLRSIGSYIIPESMYDGNHVMVVAGEAPWKRQVKLLGGYAAFYNPANFVRALKRDGSPLRRRRIRYQLAGMAAVISDRCQNDALHPTPHDRKAVLQRGRRAAAIKIRHPDQAFRRWPTTVKQKDRLTASSTERMTPQALRRDATQGPRASNVVPRITMSSTYKAPKTKPAGPAKQTQEPKPTALNCPSLRWRPSRNNVYSGKAIGGRREGDAYTRSAKTTRQVGSRNVVENAGDRRHVVRPSWHIHLSFIGGPRGRWNCFAPQH